MGDLIYEFWNDGLEEAKVMGRWRGREGGKEGRRSSTDKNYGHPPSLPPSLPPFLPSSLPPSALSTIGLARLHELTYLSLLPYPFAMFRGRIMRPMHSGRALPQIIMLRNGKFVEYVCLVVCAWWSSSHEASRHPVVDGKVRVKERGETGG